MTCPCQSERDYAECCQPYHQGQKLPPTALELMRSRYCAYALKEVDYIVASEVGAQKAAISAWAERAEFVALRVLEHTHLMVRFEADYELDGQLHTQRETSWFERHPEQGWMFVPGNPKAGRNDPCPCGSGQKFKKCCLL
jgi:SEC-C motif-containing protein